MPGTPMSGLAMRSGCVMLTLDLVQSAEENNVLLSTGVIDVITRLMRNNLVGRLLEDGASLCIQVCGDGKAWLTLLASLC